ncbi:hypothetical protein M378DRAFT_167791, partial [Amanita muscaria Koide BX008]
GWRPCRDATSIYAITLRETHRAHVNVYSHALWRATPCATRSVFTIVMSADSIDCECQL